MRLSLLLLMLLTLSPAAPGRAAPPRSRAVVDKARAAQPAPDWAHATWLQEVGPGGPPPALALRVMLSPRGVVRQDVQGLRDGYALETLVWADEDLGVAGARPLVEAPAWLQVLAGRDLRAILAAKGVADGRTSLAHDGSTILWVLGAGPHDPDLPQLHVERATGRLRAFVERVAGVDGVPTSVAVTLSGRAAEVGPRAAWPQRITIAPKGGAPVTFALQRLELGQPIADALLLPPALAPAEAAPAVPLGPAAMPAPSKGGAPSPSAPPPSAPSPTAPPGP
ncbi:MAG: hypothetical protein CSA66_00535 [Proteobacteria bacterium]|nr:MAG: hypothetical protein CSA66_00535 [Pseudomonadota bacterium]